jgi:hypothetical protein
VIDAMFRTDEGGTQMNQPHETDDARRNVGNAEVGSTRSAGRPPTDEETEAADEQFADGSAAEREEVARHEKEMMEIGAEVKGEGSID